MKIGTLFDAIYGVFFFGMVVFITKGYIIPVLIILYIIGHTFDFRTEEEKEFDDLRSTLGEEVRKKQQEKELRLEQSRKEEERMQKIRQYQELRKSIGQMPKYAKWKNDVFDKNGRRCDICGKMDNLEIHHRTSFYSLIQRYNITDIHKAFECDSLWDINNGSVLCRVCHEKTESYQYRDKISNNACGLNITVRSNLVEIPKKKQKRVNNRSKGQKGEVFTEPKIEYIDQSLKKIDSEAEIEYIDIPF